MLHIKMRATCWRLQEHAHHHCWRLEWIAAVAGPRPRHRHGNREMPPTSAGQHLYETMNLIGLHYLVVSGWPFDICRHVVFWLAADVIKSTLVGECVEVNTPVTRSFLPVCIKGWFIIYTFPLVERLLRSAHVFMQDFYRAWMWNKTRNPSCR